MDIIKSTKKYEKWLSQSIEIVQPDLELKHKNMTDSPFSFLRATFYRWVQLFNKKCEKLIDAYKVLSVGDLHIENFGTWRDIEGRLIWGINDFDEAYTIPYTNDLVRLATSTHMAINEGHLKIEKTDACDSILKGYKEGLEVGGKPFVLSEDKHNWLRETATFRLKNPVDFWNKLEGNKEIKKAPDELVKMILKNMPGYSDNYKVVQRIAGLGSLGRKRYVIITDWAGGKIAREAKSYAPSACIFAYKSVDEELNYDTIVNSSIRCKDPFLLIKKNWIIRRLAPDCSRIELTSLPKEHDEKKLLYSMGWETANVHLGSKNSAKNILNDIAKRDKNWLHDNSSLMLEAVEEDQKEWKKEFEKEDKSR